jgi:glycine oxidase
VIGAGLIGLSCAWRARKRGMSVLVVDRAESAGAGTSDVAAGMLAPVTEMDFGEDAPLRANMLARERWPAFAAELEEVTGLPTGYRDTGALVVAADRDDAEALRRLHELHTSLGLASEWLTPSRCRQLEPGLSPRIAGGILAPQDGSADPRATVRALAAAAGEVELGVEVETGRSSSSARAARCRARSSAWSERRGATWSRAETAGSWSAPPWRNRASTPR